MKSLLRNSQPGFTLLEIIATLIIASILGSLVYSYFGSAFMGSSTPIARLNKAFHLHEAMENITADYNNHTIWQASASYSINAIVIPTTKNWHFYRCTTAGTSGASEPTWPITKAGTVADGSVTWTENGKLPVLKDNIDALNYGTYTVVENKYIKFNPSSNQEEYIVSGDPENILKVKIQNDLGETLTALFTSED
jgi:prepilin-type N-terminal cleavage/methylation domain-containing protein